MAWPDELVFQLEPGPRSRGYVAPLEVGSYGALEMLADPNSLRSLISERAWAALITSGLALPAEQPRRCSLRDLRIQGQTIPDLEVLVSSTLRRVDGVLGLDFFRNYRSVELDTSNLRIVLRN